MSPVNNLTEEWGEIRDKIGATRETIVFESFTPAVENDQLAEHGITGQELFELQSNWNYKVPLIDSKGNLFVLFIYNQVAAKHFTYKFHFAWCRTLEEMTMNGRRSRYKAKYNLSEELFTVSKGGAPDEQIKIEVCKNCLVESNYHDYEQSSYLEKKEIYSSFNIEDCIKEYDISNLPKPTHPNHTGRYVSNWPVIAREFKNERENRCEKCGNSDNLHAHHVNGTLDDNRATNIQVLCKTCHAQEYKHEHMKQRQYV